MKKIFVVLLSFMTVVQAQANQEFKAKMSQIKPHIRLVKAAHADGDFSYENRYLFQVCNGANDCQTLGSEIGYTKQQLTGSYGRLQQVGGVTLGVAATVAILYTGVSGAVIGWQSGFGGSIGGAMVGGTAGVVVPTATLDFFDSINPIEIFRQGGVKADMENGVLESVQNAQTIVVLFENLSLKRTLEVAEMYNKALNKKGDPLYGL